MWIMKVPVISTAHLRLETFRLLEFASDWFTATYDEGGGLFIWVDEYADLDEAPEDLRIVMKWAREAGFDWLRFDNCGDDVPGLPTYDWS